MTNYIIDGVFSSIGSLIWRSNPPTQFGPENRKMDWWYPVSNRSAIVAFPPNVFNSYHSVYSHKEKCPDGSYLSILSDIDTELISKESQPCYHLALSIAPADPDQERFHYSIHRNTNFAEFMSVSERCVACWELFNHTPNENPQNFLKNLLSVLQKYSFWRSEHVAVECDIAEYFGANFERNRLSLLTYPEGWSPLMIAISNSNEKMIRILIDRGSDLTQTDILQNNILHFAATTNSQIIQLLWNSSPVVRSLLMRRNCNGATPQYIAWSNVKARCVSTFMSLSKIATESLYTNPLFQMMRVENIVKCTMESLIEKNPKLYTERDPITGNSVLHVAIHKTPVLILLEILENKLDVNVRDASGRAPLHVYANRNDLELIFAIITYDCDVDAQDKHGNTPLHIAVVKGHLDVVRGLLCMGANPNIVNGHSETPRHLAAKSKNPKSQEILRSLVMMRAECCQPNHFGCTVDCAHKENIVLRLQKRSLENMGDAVTVEVDGVLVEEGPDPVPVKKVESVTRDELITDVIHTAVLSNIHAELDKITDPSKSDIISVISCDGGGVKGIIMSQFLVILQQYLKHPVLDYFDWGAGTSCGTNVLFGLLIGHSIRKIHAAYLVSKDRLFYFWSRPYSVEKLEKMTKEITMGRMMGDTSYPRALITTVRANVCPARLEFIRNYRLPLDEKENEKLGFRDPKSMSCFRAFMRTSAAPTFFPCAEGKYVDGGLMSNNPTIDLLAEIALWNSVCKAKQNCDKPDPAARAVRVGLVLSLGTGKAPEVEVDSSLIAMADPLGIVRGMKNLSKMILVQLLHADGCQVVRARRWAHSIGATYYRFCPILHKEISLDVSNSFDVCKMMWDCEVHAFEHKKEVKELAELLEKIGPNYHRKKTWEDGIGETGH